MSEIKIIKGKYYIHLGSGHPHPERIFRIDSEPKYCKGQEKVVNVTYITKKFGFVKVVLPLRGSNVTDIREVTEQEWKLQVIEHELHKDE